ncbi:NAD(P)-binding protein [Pholiota conissans]|uniref:NAD(P)-binding protein n=1 Tax=Pholiota conissans TaxID=109636 RepID=A0A9P5ZDR3_9AGAR|nr:NAD(P)-binding protein [Pholiota conissans]
MSKVILVTGANAGIGFELTRLLAEKGHTVYLGARNEVSGKEAAEKLHKEGLKTVKHVLIDVTKLPTIKAAKETIEGAEGYLDVLVNNAGIAKFDSDQNATTIELATIRETMETNFFGLIQTTQTFLPLLRKSSNGVIVSVTSDMASNAYMAAHTGPLHLVAYNTSKAAMNSYSIALAHELKKDNIKVNLVTPGYTSTKLNFFGDGGKSTLDGAKSIEPWALLEKDGPTGKFVDWNGKDFSW